MDFHSVIIEDSEEKTENKLFSYAMEIAVQIALCENYLFDNMDMMLMLPL